MSYSKFFRNIIFIVDIYRNIIVEINYFHRTSDGIINHRKGYIAGYGSKFVFGTRSDQSPGTQNNPSKYSSCMTSEKGPLNSRFKYCNTKKVTQNCYWYIFYKNIL